MIPTDFKKRLDEFLSLKKTIDTEIPSNLVQFQHPEATKIVDYKGLSGLVHPSAPEEFHDFSAHLDHMIASPMIHRENKRFPAGGLGSKAIVVTPDIGSLLKPVYGRREKRVVMIKPISEATPIHYFWGSQRIPISGFAETTYRDLLHASGQGESAPFVKITHIKDKDGVDQPFIVSRFHKGYKHFSNFIQGPEHREQLASQGDHFDKLFDQTLHVGLLDFLANNTDNNTGNIGIVGPHPDTEVKEPHILSIDNDRSFRYLSPPSHRKEANDSILNYFAPKTDLFDRVTGEKKANFIDRQAGFKDHPSLRNPLHALAHTYGRDVSTEEFETRLKNVAAKMIFGHGEDMYHTFHKALEHVKDPVVKEHLKNSFNSRLKHLVNFARGAAKIEDPLAFHEYARPATSTMEDSIKQGNYEGVFSHFMDRHNQGQPAISNEEASLIATHPNKSVTQILFGLLSDNQQREFILNQDRAHEKKQRMLLNTYPTEFVEKFTRDPELERRSRRLLETGYVHHLIKHYFATQDAQPGIRTGAGYF